MKSNLQLRVKVTISEFLEVSPDHSEWNELLLRMLRHFTEDLDLVENHLVVVFLDVLTTTGCC